MNTKQMANATGAVCADLKKKKRKKKVFFNASTFYKQFNIISILLFSVQFAERSEKGSVKIPFVDL